MDCIKKIKLKFVGFYKSFIPEQSLIWSILSKKYDVSIDEDNPDYIICGCYAEDNGYYVYCQYPQIRIMIVGENYVPDFNLIDYAISNYPVDFYDRNFYLPQCAAAYLYNRRDSFENKDRNYDRSLLNGKTRFANFISSHESENGIRGDFFKLLSKYKRVDSVGSYLNNMPNGECVDWTNDSKVDFQRTCKFSLCFESTSNYGFCTEKIMDAFFADTIPVYWGDPNVTDIFNEKAFINCLDYKSFEDVVKQIIELDQDDDKYLEMMSQPILKDNRYLSKKRQQVEEYILHIFDQPYEKAWRRSRCYSPENHNIYLKEMYYISEKKKKINDCLYKNIFAKTFVKLKHWKK